VFRAAACGGSSKQRMIGQVALKAEPAEPAVSNVEMDLFTQPALGANLHELSDDQLSNHQLGIDRRPISLTVEGTQVLAHIRQVDESIDGPYQVVGGNVPPNVEAVNSAS
jgi:hypothetical protein